MIDEPTQEKINEIFEVIKAEWDKLILESGQTESMAIALSKPGVTYFLAQYHDAKQEVEALGLVMPELVKGLKITIEG